MSEDPIKIFTDKKNKPKRINTVLLNPTIDQIYEIKNFKVGGTYKVSKNIVYPVGKAISFSLGIRELSKQENIIKVIACIGKNEIQTYSNFLNSYNIKFKFIEVDGKTRSNKTINDRVFPSTSMNLNFILYEFKKLE
jgi:fructose-1-phosphate kinase PfkB-like protein